MPLTNLEEWKTKCLGPKQYGNCAFQQYAQRGTAPGQTNVPCPADVGGSTDLLESVQDGPAVCFANRKDASDILCIFQDFGTGNVNAEQMAPATRASNLDKLIQGAAEYNKQVLTKQDLTKKRFCLHRGEWASVGWTHLHTFDDTNSSWPDGLSDKNAYCTTWKGSTLGTAQALDDLIVKRANGCERIGSSCCVDMGSTPYCTEAGLHCHLETLKCMDDQDPSMCSSNPGCVAKGLSGDALCCPTASGVKLACC